MTVEALAVWDEGGDGFPNPVVASLWTGLGGLLGTATIDGASDALGSAPGSGLWRFESLAAPVALTPGVYAIGANFRGADPIARVSAGFATIPEISFLGPVASVAGPDSGVLFPGSPFGTSVFGPTLLVSDGGTAVPLPAPALMLLGGLAALVAAGRRRAG